MADLASLRISVDSRDVTAASQSLNSMGSAATGAENSIRGVGAAAVRSSVALSGMNNVIAQGAAAQAATANAMRAVGQTGQLASHQITNLAFQFQDLGVQIASGQNPLVAFMQQGAQIQGIMMQSGMSTKQFGAALLSMIGILKTTSNAELDAAAASTASTAARFRGLNAQATEAIVAAQAELALAAAQAEGATTAAAVQAATDRRVAAQQRLAAAQLEAATTAKVLTVAEAEAAAAATAAGVATSTAFAPVTAIILAVAAAAVAMTAGFSLIADQFDKSGEVEAYAKSMGMTKEQIEKAGGASVTTMDTIKGLWITISEGLNLGAIFDTLRGWLDQAGQFAIKSAKVIYTAFAGTFDAVKIIWKSFPAVLSDLFIQAVNKAIGAVGFLVNKIIEGINKLAGEPLLSPIKFAQIANANAGAAEKAAAQIGEAYSKRYGQAGEAVSQWDKNSQKVAKARLDEERKQKKAAKERQSEEQKLFEQRVKQAEDFIKNLDKETAAIGKTAIEIKRVEIAAAAAAAPTKELADRIKAAGEAWEQATRGQAVKDFQTNIIKPLQDELKLVGLSGEARAKRALELEEEGFKSKALADGIADVNAAWEQYSKAKLDIINAESAFEKEQKKAEELRKTLSSLVSLTDDLFGGAGSFLQSMGNEIRIAAPDLEKNLKEMFDAFPQETRAAFDGFLQALPGVLANAKIGSMVGGGVGGAIGGAIGGALGKEFLTKGLQDIGGKVFGKALGSMAGPLGAIAGGLLGGLVGGLLTKTKTGSATLTQIAGGAMQKTLSGNNAALKAVADKMANGLIASLSGIAEQLGGTLGGNVNVSIGQRKKDFVVDPTGGGRTKGSGVINFGQDQAAAVAYVTQLSIQQGIITGISAGAQTLIRAGNDLNAQVQKALKFDQVFKDLLKETDPVAASLDDLATELEKLKAIFDEAGASAEEYAKLEELYAIKQAKAIAEADKPRRELEIQLMEAQGNAAGALAARRQLELESMDVSLRALQQQVWAAEDAAKAALELADAQARAAEEANAAAEQAKMLAADRRNLEIDLMEALGNSAEALAARRAIELDAMDESLRGLQRQVWAAQDAAEAQKKLAEEQEALQKATEDRIAEEQRAAQEAAEKAADILRTRTEMEVELLELQGNKVEALAIRRQLELDAMDESLRGLQQQINAQQDLNEIAEAQRIASEAAAEAAANAAEEAQRLAEDAAQKQLELAQKRASMEVQLLEAQGKAAEAVAAQRAIELAAMDESLRPLQSLIWSYQDAAVAQEAAAKAAEDVARTAEEAAAAQRKLAEDRLSLEIELMRALGDETGALAAQRARELSQMDESLRGLQSQIWAAEDAKKAQESLAETQRQAAAAFAEAQKTAAQAVEQARNDLSGAYEREANAIKAVRDRFAGFAASLREFRDSLIKDNGGGGYAQELARFSAVAREAALGNADAMGALPEAGRNFLEAARANAGSAQDYQRDVARVMQAVDAAIGTADRTVAVQDMQLSALTSSVEQLIDLNTNVLGVEEAIKNLNDALTAEAALTAGATTASGQPVADVFADTAAGIDNAAETLAGANQTLSEEVKGLREELKAAMFQIAKNTGKSYDMLNKWDGDGLPETRVIAA